MIKKYTYEDWFNGNVVLEYSRRVFNPKEQAEPIVVSWDNFNEEERSRIAQKQQQLFEEGKTKLFNIRLKDIQVRLERSVIKQELINRLLKQHDEILNGKLNCGEKYCHTLDMEETFHFKYYQEMMQYINLYVVGGRSYDFCNVSSPNCPYKDDSEGAYPPEVTGTALLEIRKILLNEKYKLKNGNVSDQTQSIPEKEIHNPCPHIFKSYNAYLLYCDLEKKMLSNKKSNLTVLSFIYHKMRDPDVSFLINDSCSVKAFGEFLVLRNIPVDYPFKLKKRSHTEREQIFQIYYEKYFPKI
jgi:hypothetical protein